MPNDKPQPSESLLTADGTTKNVTAISKGQELYHTILGWTAIVAVLAAIGSFVWAKHHYNAERRMAGTWSYDASSRRNTGGTGQGTTIVFAGKNISVFDAGGRRLYSFDWTVHRYHNINDEDFPIGLSLSKTENILDGAASMMLSKDDSRMLFRIDEGGPTRAAEFHRVR
jgi:hypothetical protein